MYKEALLAIASVSGQQFLYATNFRSGKVEVYKQFTYSQVSLSGDFTGPRPDQRLREQ